MGHFFLMMSLMMKRLVWRLIYPVLWFARLNVLQIAGKDHTRNMYRKEWRSGEQAEIRLASDEQKLVTALVQKKVGEMLVKENGSPSFQTGLLASFESYAESTGSGAG